MNRQHSYSRLDVFEKCPLKYKLRHIDKIPAQTPKILYIGTAIHECIAEYFRQCIQAGVPELFDRWEDIVREVLNKLNVPEEYEEEIYGAIKTYVESRTVPLDSVYGVEQRFALNRDIKECDWMAEDVYFRFIIDLLQIKGHVARITDYKTGHLFGGDKFQQELYAWGIMKHFPQITRVEAVFDYTRYDMQHEKTYDIKDIEYIEKKLKAKCDKVEAEEKWKPTINATCDYCEYTEYCPLMEKAKKVKFKAPENKEEARQMALDYVATDISRKEIQNALKKYIDNTGQISAGGKDFTFKADVTYKDVDIPHLVEEAEAEGFTNILRCLNFDKRKAKGLMENEKFIDILKANSKQAVSVRFSITKEAKGEANGNRD